VKKTVWKSSWFLYVYIKCIKDQKEQFTKQATDLGSVLLKQ